MNSDVRRHAGHYRQTGFQRTAFADDLLTQGARSSRSRWLIAWLKLACGAHPLLNRREASLALPRCSTGLGPVNSAAESRPRRRPEAFVKTAVLRLRRPNCTALSGNARPQVAITETTSSQITALSDGFQEMPVTSHVFPRVNVSREFGFGRILKSMGTLTQPSWATSPCLAGAKLQRFTRLRSVPSSCCRPLLFGYLDLARRLVSWPTHARAATRCPPNCDAEPATGIPAPGFQVRGVG